MLILGYLKSYIIFHFTVLQLFDLFDLKQDGVIEFEEFVRSLNIFHPNAPEAEKLACKTALTEYLTSSCFSCFTLRYYVFSRNILSKQRSQQDYS